MKLSEFIHELTGHLVERGDMEIELEIHGVQHSFHIESELPGTKYERVYIKPD